MTGMSMAMAKAPSIRANLECMPASTKKFKMFMETSFGMKHWKTGHTLVLIPWGKQALSNMITVAIMWDDGVVVPHRSIN